MSKPPPPPGPPPGPVPGEPQGAGEATGPPSAPGSPDVSGPPESSTPGGGFGPPPPPQAPSAEPPAAPPAAPPGPPADPTRNPPPTPPPASATPPEQAYSPPGAPPPPGEGFGTPLSSAPSTPPPAGEPGAPGYGYPQGGYGHPQPGYGYPTPPYGDAGQGGAPTGAPPPYGVPTEGMGPAVPPSGPSGPGGPGKPGGTGGSSGNRGPLLVVLVGVVVAALVAGGFGLWHVVQDGDSGTPSADPVEDLDEPDEPDESDDAQPSLPDEPWEAELLHSELQGDADDYHSFETSWVAGDLVVRPRPGSIAAADTTTGDDAWVYEMENRGDCQASPTQSEGRIALLEGRDCEQLTVLDLSSGEVVWTTPLPNDHDVVPGNRDRPAILGDYVALSWTPGGYGWSISQEQLLWEPDTADSCGVTDYGVMDGSFVEAGLCGVEWSTSNPGYVRGTTPEGEELWRFDYEAEHDDEELYLQNVVSVEPVVLMVTLGDSGVVDGTTEFWVLDEGANGVETVLDLNPDRQSYSCARWEGLVGCGGMLAHDGHLYVSHHDADQGVSVFDLGNGNEIYRAEPVLPTGGQLIPFDAVDEKVLVYQQPRGQEPGTVLAIDPDSEEAEELLVMTHETVDIEADPGTAREADIFWDDNRLFLVDGLFMDDYEEDVQVAVFG